ncbi:MAG: NYN domain-containing protein [Planctomycetes bacterium]|nr:NYN domain-containing protein [Planctomycetota bacterium]
MAFTDGFDEAPERQDAFTPADPIDDDPFDDDAPRGSSADEAAADAPAEDATDGEADAEPREREGRRGRRRRGRDRERERRREERERSERAPAREGSRERGEGRDRSEGRERGEGRDRSEARGRGEMRSRDEAPAPLPPRQRVAILLDATALDGPSSGESIAYGHLRRRVAGGRSTVRAIAYHSSRKKELATSLAHAGFETVGLDNKSAANLHIAIDAMTLASRVDCVVVVPGNSGLAPLTKALRAAGVRVETASFDEAGEDPKVGQHHHVLGHESSFVV